jgi:hypothetical protein
MQFHSPSVSIPYRPLNFDNWHNTTGIVEGDAQRFPAVPVHTSGVPKKPRIDFVPRAVTAAQALQGPIITPPTCAHYTRRYLTFLRLSACSSRSSAAAVRTRVEHATILDSCLRLWVRDGVALCSFVPMSGIGLSAVPSFREVTRHHATIRADVAAAFEVYQTSSKATCVCWMRIHVSVIVAMVASGGPQMQQRRPGRRKHAFARWSDNTSSSRWRHSNASSHVG